MEEYAENLKGRFDSNICILPNRNILSYNFPVNSMPFGNLFSSFGRLDWIQIILLSIRLINDSLSEFLFRNVLKNWNECCSIEETWLSGKNSSIPAYFSGTYKQIVISCVRENLFDVQNGVERNPLRVWRKIMRKNIQFPFIPIVFIAIPYLFLKISIISHRWGIFFVFENVLFKKIDEDLSCHFGFLYWL